MSRIIKTNDGNYYQKAGAMRTSAGVSTGMAAQGAITLGGGLLSLQAIKGMKALHEGVDRVEVKNALNNALKNSGAADKGVKIVDYAGKQVSKTHAYDLLSKIYKKIARGEAKPSDLKIKRIFNKIIHNEIKLGNNAGFDPKLNKVFINTDKLGLAGFHEIGHSINKNLSKFWHGMQKLRMPGMIAAGVIGTIAVFKRKKVEGEEPKNIIDKTTTFIKNNAGKLTLLSFVPIVAEELKATARGNKLAKQLLSPELAKKVAKCNAFGAATYVLTAGLTALAAVLGSKIRDSIAKPKEINVSQ